MASDDSRTIWSPERKRMGAARLRELFEVAGSLETAQALMKKAIDRASCETNGQFAWEDVFGTPEQMLYWLDDDNFEKETVQ